MTNAKLMAKGHSSFCIGWLLEHSRGDERGFLLGREQAAEVFLGLGQLLTGLGAGVAEGGHLGLELLGVGVGLDGLLELAAGHADWGVFVAPEEPAAAP